MTGKWYDSVTGQEYESGTPEYEYRHAMWESRGKRASNAIRYACDTAYPTLEGRLSTFNLSPEEIERLQKEYRYSYEGQLGFCYGCDEERAGNIINREGLSFPSSANKYTEQICQGCDIKLRTLKELMIPVIQDGSAEGTVIWRIERKYCNAFEKELQPYREGRYEDDYTVTLWFTDDGGSAHGLVRQLMRIKYVTHELKNDIKSI